MSRVASEQLALAAQDRRRKSYQWSNFADVWYCIGWSIQQAHLRQEFHTLLQSGQLSTRHLIDQSLARGKQESAA